MTVNTTTFSVNSTNITVGNDTSDVVGIGNNTLYVNGGNVGIGTTSPSEKLHIVGGNIFLPANNASTGGAVVGAGSGDNFSTNGVTMPHYGLKFAAPSDAQDAGGIVSFLSGYYGVRLFAGGAEVVRVNPSGNVGIGTTSPAFILDVRKDMTKTGDIEGNSAQVSIGGATTAGKRMILGYDTNSNGFGYIKAGNYGVAWTNIALQPDGGNVGIGTTSPQAKFHVFGGDILRTNSDYVNGSAGSGFVITGLASSGATDAQLYAFRGGNTSYGNIVIPGGNVGISVTSPRSLLHVAGAITSTEETGLPTTGTGIEMSYQASSARGRIIAYDRDAGVYKPLIFNDGALYVSASSAGYVGIGTTSPGYKLDVVGAVKASSYFISAANTTLDGAGPYDWIYLGPADGSAARAAAVQIGDISGAKYGIFGGDYDLSFAKHVSTGTWANAFKIIATNATDATPNMYFVNSVGIGTTSLTYKLEVNGSARAADFILSSDRRLKIDLQPINDALDSITKLNGYTFTMTKDNTRRAGLIAQDVQQVLPEAVYTDNDGYLSLSYEQIIPLLVEAIKQLNEKIEKLQ